MRQGYIVILALQETGKLMLNTEAVQRPVNFFQIKYYYGRIGEYY